MVGQSPDERPVPRWAARLIAQLSRERPAVVSREDLERRLRDLGHTRPVEQTVHDLQQLGWLTTLHLKGVWAFIPPGESASIDPYLDLRGWQARDPQATFALAGEAAAWHLGYLDRRHDGKTAIWLPGQLRAPHGLRAHVSVVRIRWSTNDARPLAPAARLLRAKGLDLTTWAAGLPAFGPDALLVQLASRPASFRSWADLIDHLDVLASDCDVDRLVKLLDGQSSSAWQRAGYLLERGGLLPRGLELLDRRCQRRRPIVRFGDGSDAVWSKEFRVNDHLIAPLQARLGKA